MLASKRSPGSIGRLLRQPILAVRLQTGHTSPVGQPTAPLCHTAPGLEQRESGAPAFRLGQFCFCPRAQPLQLHRVHEGQQPSLESRRELQRKPQVRMPGGKSQNLGSDVGCDAEAAE